MLAEYPDIILLAVTILTVLVILGFCLYLSSEKGKRQQQNKHMSKRFDSLSADIQGLSVAAVNIDERMLEYELRIKALLERIDALEKYEKSSQPYFDAIEEIRNGMDADELATRCNLTLDEAKLLVKLHRSDPVRRQ